MLCSPNTLTHTGIFLATKNCILYFILAKDIPTNRHVNTHLYLLVYSVFICHVSIECPLFLTQEVYMFSDPKIVLFKFVTFFMQKIGGKKNRVYTQNKTA